MRKYSKEVERRTMKREKEEEKEQMIEEVG